MINISDSANILSANQYPGGECQNNTCYGWRSLLTSRLFCLFGTNTILFLPEWTSVQLRCLPRLLTSSSPAVCISCEKSFSDNIPRSKTSLNRARFVEIDHVNLDGFPQTYGCKMTTRSSSTTDAGTRMMDRSKPIKDKGKRKAVDVTTVLQSEREKLVHERQEAVARVLDEHDDLVRTQS